MVTPKKQDGSLEAGSSWPLGQKPTQKVGDVRRRYPDASITDGHLVSWAGTCHRGSELESEVPQARDSPQFQLLELVAGSGTRVRLRQ